MAMEGHVTSDDTAVPADVIRLRQNIQDLLCRRVLEAVQTVLEEELGEALGAARYERPEARQGCRNGHETRRIST
ncbi:MAG: transposase [Deltaproteobacteria bacterium]|nr:transposase [Deltaproteobacteria bacterium]